MRSQKMFGTTYLFAAISLVITLVMAGCTVQMPSTFQDTTDTTQIVDIPTYEPGPSIATAEITEAMTFETSLSPVELAVDKADQEWLLPDENALAMLSSAPIVAVPPIGIERAVAPAPAKKPSRLQAVLQQAQSFGYNGEVLAEQRVAVVAEASGRALVVNVEIGDIVEAGDVLVQLDDTILEAQRAQALASLEATQANLELLLLDPDQNDLDAAQASVNAAAASYRQVVDGATNEDLRIALASLEQARAAVSVAQSGYNEVRHLPNIGALPQSLELQRTTLALESAQAQYEKVVNGATQAEIAGAYSQLVSARTQLANLQEGPKAAQIRASEAQVKQAETSLFLSQLQLDKATIVSPIDGIVTSVDTSVGSMVGNGSPVVMLLSHDVKIVIPVEEFRMSEISVGQSAIIRVDAFPDRAFDGEVAIIAPELDPATRTVQVTVRPTGDASDLAPGMFAVVDLLQ